MESVDRRVGCNRSCCDKYGHGPFDAAFVDFFQQCVRPVLTETGCEPLAHLRSEHAPNTFSALPVRLNEEVFVWFARCADEGGLDRHLRRLGQAERWREEVLPSLSDRWARAPRRLRLVPTDRSSLR
ncbi:hypothetical protein ABZ618_24370 [Streptomyces roseolus]|uniref:hypothetical protein n=1 Tax=Streptomyces roseolus TaxID=67358 RepID=UPI0033EF935D